MGSIEGLLQKMHGKGLDETNRVKKENKQSVGIIGAEVKFSMWRRTKKIGYGVLYLCRYDRPGGLLIYGIPNFKLEKFVVERRTKLLQDSGIKFVQNLKVKMQL